MVFCKVRVSIEANNTYIATHKPESKMNNTTAAQLNEVAQLIGTTDKNVVISVVIKALVDKGMTVKQAFDTLFGCGAYEKFSGVVLDAIKSKGE